MIVFFVKDCLTSLLNDMRFLFFIFILSCWSCSAIAQTHGIVSGSLTDSDALPVSYAAVGLLKASDSSIVRGVVSDSSGVFFFDHVAEGDYIISVNSVGYQLLYSTVVILSADKHEISVGQLILVEERRSADEVIVTAAAKPLVEQLIDRTVLNVENSILSEGNTALEVLEQAPGVTVDNDGNIALKGKQGVSIMINGKLTYLSQRELTALLRGTSSSAISKVEVISNPSARYDAAGNSGIINIVMKKGLKPGFNGNVYANAGSGRKLRYASGLNINYRNGRINVFAGYDYAYRGEKEYLDYTRKFGQDSTLRQSQQSTLTDEPLYTNNAKLGLDYTIDSHNTLGVLINANFGTYNNGSEVRNRIVQDNGIFRSDARSSNDASEHWTNLMYNLNYLHAFKKEGRELSADLDYSSNAFISEQSLETHFVNDNGTPLGITSSRYGRIPSTTQVYAGKVDYIHPLDSTASFETGWKSSLVKTDNDVRYDTVAAGEWVKDLTTSNQFAYEEQINAAYLNVSKSFGRFSFQVGLRGEHTYIKGYQVTIDSSFTRNYVRLFPSIFLRQELSQKQSIKLSYSRRIQRPDYEQLNPFRFYREPYLYYVGNPFLQPQFTHSFEFSHDVNQVFTTTLDYSVTQGAITWITRQVDSTNTTIQSPENVNRFTNYGLSLSATLSPFTWWTCNIFGNVFYSEYSGSNLKNGTGSFIINLKNSLKFGRGFSGELNGVYRSATVYGVFEVKPVYWISTGIQKQVLKKKGTLKLSVNDIFQTRVRRQKSVQEGLNMETYIRFDSRAILFSFSYRFGSDNKKRSRSTGNDDIQNRIKGS